MNFRKRITSAMLTVALASHVVVWAETFTVDDLCDGKIAVESLIGSPHAGFMPRGNHGCYFTKGTAANTVVLHNVTGGDGATITMTLDGDKLYAANNSTFTWTNVLYLDGQAYNRKFTGSLATKDYTRFRLYLPLGSLEYQTYYGYYDVKYRKEGSTDERWTGIISRDDNGRIKIEFGMFMLTSSIGSTISREVYSKAVYTLYDANAHAKEYRNGGSTVTQEYDMHIDLTDDGRFTFVNWYNYGIPTKGTYYYFDYNSANDCWWHDPVTGTLNGSSVEIPSQVLSTFSSHTGPGDGGVTYVATTTGGYSWDPKYYIRISNRQLEVEYPGYYINTNEGNDANDYEPELVFSETYTMGDTEYNWSATNPTIKGTFTPGEDALPTHDARDCRWVTNGGTRRTTVGGAGVLVFGENGCYTNGNGSGVQRTEISYVGNSDVTLDVDLVVNGFGATDDLVFVEGYTNTVSNDTYVDHYELYMVPGFHESIHDAGFEQHADLGHANGVSIHHIEDLKKNADTSAHAAQRAGSNDFSFKKYVDLSSLTDAQKSSDGKYSFFLKAYYKDEHNLTPTFHSLAHINSTTGIDTAFGDVISCAVVRGDAGRIIITGSDETAEVYTASGATIYSGGDREIALPAGIYVVRVGSVIAKVALR